MKILTVDIGTGTQDIFLYDARLGLENGYKMVLPSPTMMVHRRIRAATRRGEGVLLTGVTMGGGPSAWAAEAHARAGLPLFATPPAARTLNDDLEKVQAAGIQIVSEDEARRLAPRVTQIPLADFDPHSILAVLTNFGVPLDDLAALAVAVFDHGNAPPGVSDRKFRFDYLAQRLQNSKSLASFAFLRADIPPTMTRLQAVALSAGGLDLPLVVMDTAPAAVLGASFDPAASARERKLIANLGNFHTLAFRLGPKGIEGLFEHHTGELDREKLESMLRCLAQGSLTNAEVFDSNGHGALVFEKQPMPLGEGDFDVVVTGPRRTLFNPGTGLRPYFAVPFGDMMIAGCFGLLAATAGLLPELREAIQDSLAGRAGLGSAPWEE
jgi:uncharacterized protein (DUF1786 family)